MVAAGLETRDALCPLRPLAPAALRAASLAALKAYLKAYPKAFPKPFPGALRRAFRAANGAPEFGRIPARVSG